MAVVAWNFCHSLLKICQQKNSRGPVSRILPGNPYVMKGRCGEGMHSAWYQSDPQSYHPTCKQEKNHVPKTSYVELFKIFKASGFQHDVIAQNCMSLYPYSYVHCERIICFFEGRAIEIFLPPGYSPNACNSLGGAEPNPEAQSSVLVGPVVGRGPDAWVAIHWHFRGNVRTPGQQQ